MPRLLHQFLASLVAACGIAALPAAAQTSAAETTRIVVPYAPGGPLDVTARALAEAAKDVLGTVIIENKPGAGGNIGLAQVAKAPKNGHTLGIAAVATIAINPHLYASMPYDAGKDFAGVTLVARVPNVLVLNAELARELNIRSVQDLIAYAKAHPDTLNYGSGGNGSAGHIAGELLKKLAGIQAVHVPYNGANPAQLALLSREVHFNFDNLAAAAPNIKAGKLLALAVTSARESTALPGVPAINTVLPGFEIDTWWGLVAPAGTAPAALEKLNQTFTAALASPSIQQQFTTLLATPSATTAQEFDDFMQAERLKYEPLVKATGARAD